MAQLSLKKKLWSNLQDGYKRFFSSKGPEKFEFFQAGHTRIDALQIGPKRRRA